MLKTIRFKFGPTPDAAPIEITPGPMTVIVGPNNSGKSLTLQELHNSLYYANVDWSGYKVLADIEPGLPPSGQLRNDLLVAAKDSFARTLSDPDPATRESMARRLAKPDAESAQLDLLAYWLGISGRSSAAKGLIEGMRLHPPTAVLRGPPAFPPADIEAIFEKGPKKFAQLFASEDRPILELIHAIEGRSVEDLIAEGIIDLRGFFNLYRHESILLDGSARLMLAQHESSGDLNSPPSGPIMCLWHNRDNLARLRALVRDAFGLHLCIDLMDLGTARLVLADKPPPTDLEDRIDAEARAFIAAARPLRAFSDGVRTYIGLHAQLIAQDHRYIMIDEPEAFLHPPLARRLGYNLSTLAAERGASVFAATHSPDFLMGCIEAGVGVNIVRLGYHGGLASAHLLPRDELETMMVDPLLRSTGILGALFHQAAVVVEGDSDRTFYTEITERLRLHEPDTHPPVIRDCVFLDAKGKATVSRILAALRRLGVISCGIVDLDLLKDNGVCINLLRATGAPDPVCNAIGYTRSQIQLSVKDKLAALCSPNGLRDATPDERKAIQHFIREMEAHGIFLPEVGPVEGWLSHLGVRASKKTWIPAIFAEMGPVNTGLAPASGDVWTFIRQIGRYLEAQRAPARNDD